MTGQPQPGCHALVAAFVARRIEVAEFVLRFERQWRGAVPGHRADRSLASIRAVCAAYAASLATDAGYRVSEAQLRLEIQGIVAAVPASACRDGRPADLSPG